MPRNPLDPPTWLDEDDLEEWNRITSDRDFSRGEIPALAVYCSTLSLWQKVCTIVDELPAHDSNWTAKDGTSRPHPAFAVEARLASDLRNLIETLGLKPLARSTDRSTRILFVDEGPTEG